MIHLQYRNILNIQELIALNPETAKFCHSCKWIYNAFRGREHQHECRTPKNILGINVVDGNPVLSLPLCVAQRSSSSSMHCGLEGRFFEMRGDLNKEAVERLTIKKSRPSEDDI